jgi:hypothetical protein
VRVYTLHTKTPPPAASTKGTTLQHPGASLNVSDFRLDKLTAGVPPEQEFTLKPYFPSGTVGVLFGPGGVGKSLTALDLGLAVARRDNRPAGMVDFVPGPLGGVVPREAAGAAVFVTTEDATAELHRRRAALDPNMTCADAPLYVFPTCDIEGFDTALIQPAQGRRLELGSFAYVIVDFLDRIAHHAGKRVSHLVLDPAGDFISGDENSAELVKPLMAVLRRVATLTGCTIILIGHVPKTEIGIAGPTMRGSSAWIADSRAAVALWKPTLEEAEDLGRKVGADPRDLVWMNFTKANHSNAPVDRKKLLLRDKTGRLIDVTSRLAPDVAFSEAELVGLLVGACAEAAAAGAPFGHHGVGGLFDNRSDLPAELAQLSKTRLAGLGQSALDTGKLVKARAGGSGAAKFFDVPDGPLALGRIVHVTAGSRRAAIASRREEAEREPEADDETPEE